MSEDEVKENQPVENQPEEEPVENVENPPAETTETVSTEPEAEEASGNSKLQKKHFFCQETPCCQQASTSAPG